MARRREMRRADDLVQLLAGSELDDRLTRRVLRLLCAHPEGVPLTLIGSRFVHEATAADVQAVLGGLSARGLATPERLEHRGQRGAQSTTIWRATANVSAEAPTGREARGQRSAA
jgi:hypothetical protein